MVSDSKIASTHSFRQYIASANLGVPLAGSYFTVEVGKATVHVSPTTAVDTATFTGTPTASQHPISNLNTTISSSTSTPSKKPNSTGKRGVAIGTVLLSSFGLALALA